METEPSTRACEAAAVGDGLAGQVAALQGEVRQLSQTVAGLRNEAAYWRGQHARAIQRNRKLSEKLREAQGEIRKLRGELFGRKSERAPARGSDRLCGKSDHDPAEGKRQRGGQPGHVGHRRRDYSHLPERKEVSQLMASERICPRCGRPLVEIGAIDGGEQIEIEVSAYRRVISRKRYRRTCACEGCSRTRTAPLPAKLIPKGRYGVSVWVEILLDKFASYRPSARLLEAWKDQELALSCGTVTAGLWHIERLLRPIYNALWVRSRGGTFHRADETGWKVFAEQPGKIGHQWWLWVFANDEAAVYRLAPSRSHKVPEDYFHPETGGVLLVDRYGAYKAMRQVKKGGLVLAFCWAHVRRDFVRLVRSWPELEDWALQWLERIRQLYQLNRQRVQEEVRVAGFERYDQALRIALQAMRDQLAQELAQKGLRPACRQVLRTLRDHWTGLTRFVEDHRIPMDNNQSERNLRGPAVGRKNYYGSGSCWTGQLAAAMFSIVATLRMHGINCRGWLKWYLESCAAHGGRPPRDIQPFLPWNLPRQRRLAA